MSDSSQEGNHNGNLFWLGMVFGGIVGATAAFLATADDENKIKRTLIKKGKTLLENLGEFKEDVEEKGEELKEEVQERVQEGMKEIPEVAQEAVENVQKAANSAISEIVKAADSAENSVHHEARKFFLKKGKPLLKK